jgi:hypothetical protein
MLSWSEVPIILVINHLAPYSLQELAQDTLWDSI